MILFNTDNFIIKLTSKLKILNAQNLKPVYTLKGDTPTSIYVSDDTVFYGTHTGILNCINIETKGISLIFDYRQKDKFNKRDGNVREDNLRDGSLRDSNVKDKFNTKENNLNRYFSKKSDTASSQNSSLTSIFILDKTFYLGYNDGTILILKKSKIYKSYKHSLPIVSLISDGVNVFVSDMAHKVVSYPNKVAYDLMNPGFVFFNYVFMSEASVLYCLSNRMFYKSDTRSGYGSRYKDDYLDNSYKNDYMNNNNLENNNSTTYNINSYITTESKILSYKFNSTGGILFIMLWDKIQVWNFNMKNVIKEIACSCVNFVFDESRNRLIVFYDKKHDIIENILDCEYDGMNDVITDECKIYEKRVKINEDEEYKQMNVNSDKYYKSVNKNSESFSEDGSLSGSEVFSEDEMINGKEALMNERDYTGKKHKINESYDYKKHKINESYDYKKHKVNEKSIEKKHKVTENFLNDKNSKNKKLKNLFTKDSYENNNLIEEEYYEDNSDEENETSSSNFKSNLKRRFVDDSSSTNEYDKESTKNTYDNRNNINNTNTRNNYHKQNDNKDTIFPIKSKDTSLLFYNDVGYLISISTLDYNKIEKRYHDKTKSTIEYKDYNKCKYGTFSQNFIVISNDENLYFIKNCSQQFTLNLDKEFPVLFNLTDKFLIVFNDLIRVYDFYGKCLCNFYIPNVTSISCMERIYSSSKMDSSSGVCGSKEKSLSKFAGEDEDFIRMSNYEESIRMSKFEDSINKSIINDSLTDKDTFNKTIDTSHNTFIYVFANNLYKINLFNKTETIPLPQKVTWSCTHNNNLYYKMGQDIYVLNCNLSTRVVTNCDIPLTVVGNKVVCFKKGYKILPVPTIEFIEFEFNVDDRLKNDIDMNGSLQNRDRNLNEDRRSDENKKERFNLFR